MDAVSTSSAYVISGTRYDTRSFRSSVVRLHSTTLTFCSSWCIWDRKTGIRERTYLMISWRWWRVNVVASLVKMLQNWSSLTIAISDSLNPSLKIWHSTHGLCEMVFGLTIWIMLFRLSCKSVMISITNFLS
uniref:(northern house mosquito) hypothetical protein n=1 Tax=Culex pipiens TaxID=7175 RepID=A0A8D8FLL5_CULPI